MDDQPTKDVVFTDAVKAVQERKGSRAHYARWEAKGGWRVDIDDELADFIAERDSFYLATANAEGQPYIQHRGGPKGFLKIIGPRTLAFADFAGNRQYITTGNLSENDKASVFLMDYRNRRRIKVWGTAHVSEDAELIESLADPAYDAKLEQAIVFEITGYNSNCPQHIRPRVTEDLVADEINALRERIAELEAELAALKEK